MGVSAVALAVKQMGTPPAPGAGNSLIYPKSDGVWYTRAGASGGETPVGGGSVADTGWLNMQLINGWVGYDSGASLGGSGRAAQYRKIGLVVYFRGVIRSGGNGANFWVGPGGYRMATTTAYEGSWVVSMSGGIGNIIHNAAGGEFAANWGSPTNGTAFTYLTGVSYITT